MRKYNSHMAVVSSRTHPISYFVSGFRILSEMLVISIDLYTNSEEGFAPIAMLRRSARFPNAIWNNPNSRLHTGLSLQICACLALHASFI